MLTRGYAKTCMEPRSFGYAFTKGEPMKMRRRVIHDTLGPNHDTPQPMNPAFTTVRTLQSKIYPAEYAATIDFKCYFYQFTIAESVQPYMTFKFGESTYAVTRLPMGFTHSVTIAQTTTRWIADKARGDTYADAYVDNILFLGSREQVQRAVENTTRMCRHYNVTIGDTKLGTSVEHRGMIFDVRNKTVAVKSGYEHKMRRRIQQATTWAQWRAVIGMTVHVHTVRYCHHARIFHVLKFLAKHTLQHPKTKTTPWAEAVTEIDETCAACHVPVKPPAADDRDWGPTIVTDACIQTGIIAAVMCTTSGKIEVITKRVDHTHDISEMEALAVLKPPPSKMPTSQKPVDRSVFIYSH
eukprot:PhM_4_TR13919/c1_g1_i6/m.40046